MNIMLHNQGLLSKIYINTSIGDKIFTATLKHEIISQSFQELSSNLETASTQLKTVKNLVTIFYGCSVAMQSTV
jgi:hypothetical protein